MLRALGRGSERLSYEANDWLMRKMKREAGRKCVTAVHSYEDCSLWPFEEARRVGKACIYDMPIGYYPAWQDTEASLARKYADWLPSGGLPSSRFVRPEQKKAEMALADLVLAPSAFTERTIKEYHPHKLVERAPYGVDLDFWRPRLIRPQPQRLTFIYGGQIAIRKGMPDLLDAWRQAALKDARLVLVGAWQLSDQKRHGLPADVEWHPPCEPERLRAHFHDADIFVMPSHFEGFGLALLEAMACALVPVASDVTAIADISSPSSFGRIIPAGNSEALVEALQWASDHRDLLPAMGRAARRHAEHYTWESYRRHVREAVARFV
jgi:glycosyltransferase involved in cell wall biosynthesis